MTEDDYIKFMTADGILVEEEEHAKIAHERCDEFLGRFRKKKS